jgi:hypothetical protein
VENQKKYFKAVKPRGKAMILIKSTVILRVKMGADLNAL